MLRPAVFIRIKRLNVLLRLPREPQPPPRSSSTNTAASRADLIEDVLEQIVGDIETNTTSTKAGNIISRRRPLPRACAHRDRAVQRDVRHRFPRRRSRHDRRADHASFRPRPIAAAAARQPRVRDPARRCAFGPRTAGAPQSARQPSRRSLARGRPSRASRAFHNRSPTSASHGRSDPVPPGWPARRRHPAARCRAGTTSRTARQRSQYAQLRTDAAWRLAATRRIRLVFAQLTRTASWRSAALTGGAFGFGNFITGIWWLYISMHVYGRCRAARRRRARAVLAVPVAVPGALRRAVVVLRGPCVASPHARPAAVLAGQHGAFAFASAWALGEWLRGTVSPASRGSPAAIRRSTARSRLRAGRRRVRDRVGARAVRRARRAGARRRPAVAACRSAPAMRACASPRRPASRSR